MPRHHHSRAPRRARRPKAAKHPMQPVVVRKGVVRFHENCIVSWMLDQLTSRGVGLTQIATMFAAGRFGDDYQQLMQLTGYSVSGYGELSRCDKGVLRAADAEAERLLKGKP